MFAGQDKGIIHYNADILKAVKITFPDGRYALVMSFPIN